MGKIGGGFWPFLAGKRAGSDSEVLATLNLIHEVINKWPSQFQIQHLEKFKVKVPWTSQSYFKQ